ncbi:MAG: cell division protein FtsA [candidate division WOR-3 bacterium]|nr:cell division protein FtsA [candidate division WOR-3 bacterium]
MARSKKLLGIDIGTTKIACVIAELDNSGRINILGQGISSPEGFKNGIVNNLEKAVVSMAEAIEAAENTSNVKAKNTEIYVGIAGEYIEYLTSVGTAKINNPTKGITNKDINECIKQAQTLRLPNDEQIIHLIPNQFIVDGQRGIRNPLGMFGFRLEVETLLIIGSISVIENIHRVIDSLGLKITSLVLQPEALSLVVAEPDDKDLGVAIVDIGGISNISIYKDGVLKFYKTIPLGGINLTKDISIGLRTPYKKAEEIKKQHGAAMVSSIEHEEPIIIEDMSGRTNRQVSKRLLTSIIEMRIEEILQHINEVIMTANIKESLGGGVILTGGTSQLKGIDILAEQIFQMPVKIGNKLNSAEGQTPLDPIYETAVGLVHYGINGHNQYLIPDKNLLEQLLQTIKQLFI